MQSLHPSPHKLISLAGGQIPLMSLVLLYLTLCLSVAAQSGNQPSAPLIREGQSALDAGDFSRAVQTFEKAEQLSPENPEVNRGLVLSYLHAGRLIDAQRIAESAVERWPRDAQLQHWLGLVYFKQG
ncbi:MAG TPA: tetratricopeptide repeat protein [Candidatus Sulfotelmatobacter sp.]|nr:tetratricopeptide repeat protein [Candidatus Sulfotelmatobacter sp.]